MKIYTKTGDKGTTSLYDGVRIPKDHIRVESYGTIDELNSFLGLSKLYVEDEEIYNIIEDIQNRLFTVAANLATEDKSKLKYRITEDDIKHLEDIIDKYMDEFKGFIVPGTNKASAHLHVARTICRRAERRILSSTEVVEVDPIIIKYVNRLSDVIYALGRYLETEKKDVVFS